MDTNLYIVCTSEAKPTVEATLASVDPSSTGDFLRAPVCLKGSTEIVGWWCAWAMSNMTKSAIAEAVRTANWNPRPSGSERAVYVPGDKIPAWGSQRVWLFDGILFNNDGVLNSLGLDIPPAPPE